MSTKVHAMGTKDLTADEDVRRTIENLDASYAALKRQLENPRAYPHHLIEAALAVETDARWLQRQITAAAVKES